jgi:hypothetical protein
MVLLTRVLPGQWQLRSTGGFWPKYKKGFRCGCIRVRVLAWGSGWRGGWIWPHRNPLLRAAGLKVECCRR